MKSCWLLALLTACGLVWGGALVAEETPAKKPEAAKAAADSTSAVKIEKPRFIRVKRDDRGTPLALETSVVRFVPAGNKWPGATVDLIGAVHVGDQAYYDALNKLFTGYDVVLYELVAAEGTRIPKEGRQGRGGDNPVAAVQNGMSTILELKHQLDSIDYTQANFVHADMSPEEFAKAMTQRGESFMQIFLRLMGQGIAQQAVQEQAGGAAGGGGELGLLFALFASDRAQRLKTMMAQQFEDLEGQMMLFDGPEGSTIITERNKKALEVLEKQLAAGKKKVAIFYGAGHLADMQKRLESDFSLRRDGETWITAWSLEVKKGADAPPAALPDLKIELPKP
jgi:hypothetical protein